ncbi:hypothetical protein BDA99DRAFT_535688 [Phascolomyces articulosus]|uniref:Uncharacterized protein n=1 Tax=Phascolomyces articulosus TaxID=60185 RepID=A0AAD5PFF9_9FUNG|nr:hypothetical protein BDA99DRAFT_535688 [Phascolomyces articulosus]
MYVLNKDSIGTVFTNMKQVTYSYYGIDKKKELLYQLHLNNRNNYDSRNNHDIKHKYHRRNFYFPGLEVIQQGSLPLFPRKCSRPCTQRILAKKCSNKEHAQAQERTQVESTKIVPSHIERRNMLLGRINMKTCLNSSCRCIIEQQSCVVVINRVPFTYIILFSNAPAKNISKLRELRQSPPKFCSPMLNVGNFETHNTTLLMLDS